MTDGIIIPDNGNTTEKGTRMSPQEKAQAYHDFQEDFRYLESLLIQARRSAQ